MFPHFGAFVQASRICGGAGEPDQCPFPAQRGSGGDDAGAVTGIDKDGVGLVFVFVAGQDVGDVDVVVVFGAGVEDFEQQALAQGDDQLVVAFPGWVAGENFGGEVELLQAQFAAPGGVDIGGGDELFAGQAGEDAAHPDFDEVGIQAIVVYPLLDLALVGNGDFAAVYLPG